MVKFGGWVTDIKFGMPQKIASAMTNLTEKIGLGASYKFIAYLGHQEVNGTNHAVLAEQIVMTGRDVNNAVVIVFNEKPGSNDVAVVEIKDIVQGGGALGGIKVDMSTEIPEEAQKALDTVLEGWVGSDIKPFAYIGTQVVKGTNYIFAATLKRVVPGAKEYAALVVVNEMEKKLDIFNIFDIGVNDDTGELLSLGYAFTW